jgi:hypothetical protein
VPRLRRRSHSGRMSAPAAVSLSNRRETGSKSEPRGVGVDRLSFSFSVADFDRDVSAWASVTTHNPGADHERQVFSSYGARGVFVGVMDNPGLPGGYIGKVEANPARVLDPDGWEGLDPSRLFEAVEKMGRTAGELVRPAGPIVEARVKRLDVCRDFETDDPASIVRGLGPVHRPWSRRNLVHFDPARGGAQTLMVGSGSGVVRLYDKHAETKGKAPKGTLRWEVEARQDWCRNYGGIAQLGDIKEETVTGLAANRWDWSAMDRQVSGTDELIEQVMRLDVSTTVKERLIGHLVMQQKGCAYPMAKATSAKYRRLARDLGVVHDPERVGKGSTWLDWDTAEQMTEGAF